MNESSIAQLLQGQRILTAAEFKDVSDLQARLKKSEHWRSQKDQAKESECEAAYQKAKDLGYQDGLKDLYEQIKEVSENLKRRTETDHELLCQLISDAVEKLLGALPPRIITPHLIKTALAQVAETTTRCTVWVHPEVAEAVTKQLKQLDWEVAIHVETSTELALNGCQIQTPLGIIDAGLSTQLKALSLALKDQSHPHDA